MKEEELLTYFQNSTPVKQTELNQNEVRCALYESEWYTKVVGIKREHVRQNYQQYLEKCIEASGGTRLSHSVRKDYKAQLEAWQSIVKKYRASKNGPKEVPNEFVFEG